MALDGFLVQRSPMSLSLPQPVPPVPDDTARIARAAFPRGNPYLLLRDRLGPVFDDAGFADLYPRRGQPAYTPWRLALVTLLQFREGLSDRQAAEAVRARRATAVPSATAETAPTQRDRHLERIAEKGRMGWQKASGYNARARAEATIGRFKRVIGDGLRSRTDERRATEMDVAVQVLNRMLELGRPNYVRTA